ncbi:MAG: response regulator transcription factor [Mariprofundus sp.]|nr:response regulator transcription factor [Mariprofundus sp.]
MLLYMVLGTSQHGVVIIEDDEHVRNYLVEAVNGHEALSLQAAVGTLAEAREALKRALPRVVLVDLGLPDGSGIDLIKAFYDPDGDTEFMVITVFGDSSHVIPALEAGATGYLTKTTSMADVAPAIMEMIAGGAPISPAIAKKMLSRFHPARRLDAGIHLTQKEDEVLQLLSKGYNHPETAELLHISYHTLVSHVKHIYQKLAVRSRAEAMLEATKLGLINHHKDT